MRGGHNRKGSGTVEGTQSLDVTKLARVGVLSASDGGTHAIVLDYRSQDREGSQSVQQQVPIIWTPCRLGGKRPWFVCDVSTNGLHCGRRVAKLYRAGRWFACRHCYRLGYVSQRVGPIDRVHHRSARLHRLLGSEYGAALRPPPAKPKGMRWRTYERIVGEIGECNERLNDGLALALARILKMRG